MSDLQNVKKRASENPPVRTRAPKMSSLDRERNIVEQAATYFAKVGFDGSTRDLARQIGITQSLLYRYFPSKQALISTVYEHVYLAKWDPSWEDLLQDRTQPLEVRLKRFYREYSQVMLTHDWIRILIFAGLKQENINNRLFTMMTAKVFDVVIDEFYAETGIKPSKEPAVHELMIETVWALHASIFYIGMRRWIYVTPTPSSMNDLLEVLISGLKYNLHNVCERSAR